MSVVVKEYQMILLQFAINVESLQIFTPIVRMMHVIYCLFNAIAVKRN